MAGIISLFFTWPAQCCGLRVEQEESSIKMPEPVELDPELRIQTMAIAAVVRLVPEMSSHRESDFSAQPWGRTAQVAFKVVLRSDPTKAFFVKVGRMTPDFRNCLKEAGAMGIGAKVLGADTNATVQEFMQVETFPPLGASLHLPEEQIAAEAAKVGRLTAKMHRISLAPGKVGVLEPKADKMWNEVHRLLLGMRPTNPSLVTDILAVYKYIDRRPLTKGVGCEGGGLVMTHSMWTWRSVLVGGGGELFLCDLDGSKVRADIRVADFCSFMWLWDWYLPDDEEVRLNTDSYPSLAVRRALARAYLEEAGFTSDSLAVDDFLWDIEYAGLKGVVIWAALTELKFDRFGWKKTLRPLEQVLPLALEGDDKLKECIVEHGLMSAAQQGKLEEILNEGRPSASSGS